ncbi:hypothetical protein H9W90_13105 [Polaribacter pectinis]|uniref:Uncharacterized protein n=1 Tax=Polaribacter pectinis TaxID=2738844 RepID=A0A7G9L922_9FLAO|nr:hypothetical protein [Polaribacter pectinis]QNM85121.1 hypothetical protein H9W90_13105 [Polaribacter pectinis]
MFLQILPPDNVATAQSVFENEIVFVILGLAIAVYAILKFTKFLSKIKVSKGSNNPSYTS